MSLSLADIKRADVQSFREVASALDGMAAADTDLKSGVGRLPIAGDAWKGASGDAAHQELDRFGKLLEGSAESKKGAAARIRRAADEFEGVKQLLAKVEQDAAKGKFKIDLTSGKVIPPSGDYDKGELNYIETTLRQIMQAGDVANADLAAAVKAAKELPDPSSSAGAALPVTPNSSTKPDGSFGALQNLATAKPDGRPAETQAAAAGTDTQANYKEWYPKAPATGDKITIDPSKAGSFTGTVGALEKLPGAPKPPDGFGTGVARKFGDGVNSRVDGIVDEAKNLTGQGGPGAPGVAESWAKFVLGTADQMANPLGSLPGDVKDLVNDPAGFAGKKLFDVASVATTGPLGGEASAGMRGLLGDLTGAETRAIPHSIENLDSAPVVEHTPAGLADHPSPSVGLDHPAPNTGSWNHSTEHYSPQAPQLAADLNNAFTNGHVTSDLAGQVADHSTHHAPGIGSTANPDRVVLGKWDGQDGGYIGEARNNGGIYFDTGGDTWNAVGHGLSKPEADALGWQVNEQFLRQQMENQVGRIDYVVDRSRFSSVEDVAALDPSSFSAKEIDFLSRNAATYGYERVGDSWVRTGG